MSKYEPCLQEIQNLSKQMGCGLIVAEKALSYANGDIRIAKAYAFVKKYPPKKLSPASLMTIDQQVAMVLGNNELKK